MLAFSFLPTFIYLFFFFFLLLKFSLLLSLILLLDVNYFFLFENGDRITYLRVIVKFKGGNIHKGLTRK